MNGDHHFPRYHVRPPTGFVNDPNGPFVGSDGLHLYFQYRAATDGTTPVMWGHASSSDYVHWRLQPEEFRGIGGLDLEALGIPSEEQYVEMYCRRTGRARIEHWDYYLAYNMFRLAGILQGIMGRYLDGTAASEKALESGKRARPMAEAGWRQVEKILSGA